MNLFKRLKKAFQYKIELNLMAFIVANLFLLTGWIFYLTEAFGKDKLVLGLSGILVVSVLIYYKIMQSIIRPLISMERILREIAQGHIGTIKIEDETSYLGKWFGQLILDNMKGVFTNIEAVSNQVEAVIEQIRLVSGKVITSAQQQKVAVEEMSLSVHQMDKSVKKVKENARVMSTLSSSAILQMISSMEGVSKHTEAVSSLVEETSSAIEQLTISIKQVASRVEVLASLARQTLEAISQINLSIQEAESNARHSADLSRKVEEDVADEKNSVLQTVDWMNKIKEAMAGSVVVMKRLRSNSERVGEILDVIDGITDQIGLLALNASIIAAQAGEHGRGFAVVAEETKELAQRSMASTKEIESLIKSVQSDSLSAATSIEDSFNKVLEGVHWATRVGEVLEKIARSTSASREMAVRIAHETEAQSQESQRIQENTEKVMEMIQELVNTTKKENRISNQIVLAAKNMQDLMEVVRRATQEQLKTGRQISLAEEKVVQQFEHILESIQLHSKDSERVVTLIEETSQITRDNVRNVDELSVVVNEILLKQAHILKQEVSKYLVD